MSIYYFSYFEKYNLKGKNKDNHDSEFNQLVADFFDYEEGSEESIRASAKLKQNLGFSTFSFEIEAEKKTKNYTTGQKRSRSDNL
ncbi:hypothetical protein GYA19_04730 [Candidatus Beckwithbacteria bacterium]|nr:hypothetical protein [Candidatus Beckwithbacteria bacterium]